MKEECILALVRGTQSLRVLILDKKGKLIGKK
jgi:hypothetical protein